MALRGNLLPQSRGIWNKILYVKHVTRDHKMADEFSSEFARQRDGLKRVFTQGSYAELYGFLEWVLRLDQRSITPEKVNDVLELCRSPYRVIGDIPAIVPISSEAERQTLERAYSDLASSEFAGAREHLRKAAEELTAGNCAGSIRESIQAVESVARTVAGKPSLSDALSEIEVAHRLHPRLKQAS